MELPQSIPPVSEADTVQRLQAILGVVGQLGGSDLQQALRTLGIDSGAGATTAVVQELQSLLTASWADNTGVDTDTSTAAEHCSLFAACPELHRAAWKGREVPQDMNMATLQAHDAQQTSCTLCSLTPDILSASCDAANTAAELLSQVLDTPSAHHQDTHLATPLTVVARKVSAQSRWSEQCCRLAEQCHGSWQQLLAVQSKAASLQLSREQTWADQQKVARQCTQLELSLS